jgi:hypothetical protein
MGLEELRKIGLPPDQSAPLLLQKFKEIGIADSRLEEDIEIAASEVAQLEEDPILRNAQLEALDRFKMMSKAGFGPEEMAAYNQMRQQREQDVQSRLMSLADTAKREGRTGDIRAQELLSVQAGADRAAAEGGNLMSLLSQRVRQGASDLASTASNIRSQDYQAELTRRQAADERNKFIAGNTIARQRANIDRLNADQQRREAQAMQVSTANTQMSNAERMRQVEAERQYWTDKLARAQAMQGPGANLAGAYSDRANRTANMWAGIGSGIGQGIAAYGQAQADQDQLDAYNRRTDLMESQSSPFNQNYYNMIDRNRMG